MKLLRQDFNSIKVRLKQRLKFNLSPLVIFQFHKGTIKTSKNRSYNLNQHIFQFHKGTIKTLKNFIFLSSKNYFNSIKVRLKQYSVLITFFLIFYFNSIKVRLKQPASLSRCICWIFQFHKGTIKTIKRYRKLVILLNFNSIKVRLKHRGVE